MSQQCLNHLSPSILSKASSIRTKSGMINRSGCRNRSRGTCKHFVADGLEIEFESSWQE
ncbi:hypothetical protein I7I50_01091 [Histoplasma capsulatum G186AR]|uniref:Uncharacterized protein n=1 Tax=Ajellomyces capsulatus TaxID=5037 RepID=A0A8H7YUS8_AJECA|nr:hypothetical protein I7I52_09086 [Histoplasma capsulatum]QSS73061.1 hypothetical protein I7I50_01091 [Histoplasma capsulatum G186AR]